MRKLAGVVCALLCWVVIAPAIDFAALQPEGYVSDFTRVIDPASRTALENYCARVEAQAGAQIAVVTLDTLAGEPIEDVANALYRKWGIGKKATNEGVLLLLVTGDRRMRLEVGYGLEPILPDGFAGSVLRSMRPALKESRYGEAATEAVRLIGSRIAEAKGVQIDAALPRRLRPAPRAFPWPLAFFGMLFLFWILSAIGGGGGRRGTGGSASNLLLGMLIGNLVGRSMGSGRGGGGFGGFDSGGGFGGFGGGDSGGGGASSGW